MHTQLQMTPYNDILFNTVNSRYLELSRDHQICSRHREFDSTVYIYNILTVGISSKPSKLLNSFINAGRADFIFFSNTHENISAVSFMIL